LRRNSKQTGETMDTKERRYEIDWLRVIAFFLLIFYHTGMFFVPWDFHFKNSVTNEWFESWMVPLNQFRLPLLFIISGMGSYFVLMHRKTGAFFKERHIRLMIPLIFGMFVIIPPQIYFEHLYKGVNYSSYFEFYKKVFEFQSYPRGCFSWHHLWYILYIFIYSMICFPLLKFLKGSNSLNFKTKVKNYFSKPGRIYLLGLPLLLVYYGMSRQFPTTHALIGDWYNLTYSLIFFIYGILFISVDGMWAILERNRKTSLIIASIPFLFLWLFVWGPTFYIMNEKTTAFFYFNGFLKTVFIISWLLTILGYSRKFFNKTNKFLRYTTEAVYPLYILHQSVMLSFGYYIIQLPLGIIPKFVMVVIVTFGGSFAIYEIFIRRFNFMRLLFGQKPIRKEEMDLSAVSTEQAYLK
jgi:peptidoglycan/LPS O-acetylase OafA/YrhL